MAAKLASMRINQYSGKPPLSILVDVQTTDLPVLIDIIRKTLPEGVELSVHEHKEEHREARYVNLISRTRDYSGPKLTHFFTYKRKKISY